MEAARFVTREQHADLADQPRRQEARLDFIAQGADTETFLRNEFDDGAGQAVEPPQVRIA